jgi:hypothetical protein
MHTGVYPRRLRCGGFIDFVEITFSQLPLRGGNIMRKLRVG